MSPHENAALDIEEITPRQARRLQQAGAVLLDVRDATAQAGGMAEGAVALACAELTRGIGALVPSHDSWVLTICAVGRTSLAAARTLRESGYLHVASVAGGMARWRQEALPLDAAPDDADFHERYARQMRLPQIGPAGQRRLEAARVVLIGAGGLGSPAAYYLAAAGVGNLVLVDDDRVERSNLQRQILHTEARIGVPKVDSAATALRALNPRVRIEARSLRLTADTVEDLLRAADVVLDGSDNFATRYLINDACVKLAKPLVYAAVQGFEGSVGVFDAGRQRGLAPCYRCLHPQPPLAGDVGNCAEAGVLGVVPGIAGLLQANETIKLLLGLGTPLVGRLLVFDALATHFRELRLTPDPDCPTCAPGHESPIHPASSASCARE